MRPTVRGWVVIAAVVLAIASATAFGPRGLNAVAAPGVVALLAAVWQTYRFEPPTVDRDLPERGERGSTVRVRLAFETGTSRSARIVESVDEGLAASETEWALSLGNTTVEYDLSLDARGERHVGPIAVVVRDVLGLVERTLHYPDRDAILVYPHVHLLSGPRREALARLSGGAGDDRGAFDGLRHYRRGDPLRDVHWKTSARQPDEELVVKQFAAEAGERTAEIAAESTPDRADAMAEATASIAAALVDAGVSVGLTTPSGRVEPDDPEGLEALVDHLARTSGGSIAARIRADADVRVEATEAGVRVTIDDRELEFSDLAGTRLVPAEPVGVEVAA